MKRKSNRYTTPALWLCGVTLAGLSLGGNYVAITQARQLAAAQDNCAQTLNVYACKLAVVPVEAPRVQYVQADLLPPPVQLAATGKGGR